MDVIISGSSGLIGKALHDYLRTHQHAARKLVRGEVSARKRHIAWDTKTGIIQSDKIDFVDGMVHLAGAGVASGRWTPAVKEGILNSRKDGTKQVVDMLCGLKRKPDFFICASGVGYYGNRGDEIMTEDDELGSGFLAETCQAWEAATQPAVDAGIRVINARFGLVLAKGGGALGKMTPPFKMGLGGKLGSGEQYMSTISIKDALHALVFIMNNPSISGPVNITGPQPMTNKDFTKTFGKILKRPTFCGVPEWLIKKALGEMGEELFLSSCRAVPARLLDAGFEFRYPGVEDALRHQMSLKFMPFAE